MKSAKKSVKRPQQQPHSHLGKELRRIRKAKNLSVRGLASMLGFSPSFISQLENGVTSPSIASLERIAQTLGVGLRDLFAESRPHNSFIPIEERPTILSEWSKARIEALTAASEAVPIDAILVELQPGGSSGSRLHSAPSHRFAFIWRGTVVLSIEDRQYRLKQGDAMTIRAGSSHRWTNVSRRPVHMVIVWFRIP